MKEIAFFNELSGSQRDKICALFTLDQLKEINMVDAKYGYNFKDKEMFDCFFALNALPRRERRQLVARVKARKSLAGFINEDDSVHLDKALQEKFPGDLSVPSA